MLGVVVVGSHADGLFYALGIGEGTDGAVLKEELASFMVALAAGLTEDDAAQVWLEEASQLRGLRSAGQPGSLAAPLSIMAFSRLRNRRVLIHTRSNMTGPCDVKDASHPVVHEHAPVTHLLFDGSCHYDALVEIPGPVNLNDVQPAWPQPLSIPIDTSNSVQGAMLDTNGLYPVAFTLARAGLETPGDACEDVPWLLLWSSFVSWAFHPNRPDDIPGYVLHILALYIWYLGKGDCPGPFLRAMQCVLQHTLPAEATLPGWLRHAVHTRRIV